MTYPWKIDSTQKKLVGQLADAAGVGNVIGSSKKAKTNTDWDVLVLDDIYFPGIIQNCTVDIEYAYAVDKTDVNNPTLKYKGLQPKKVNLTLLIYTEDQYETFIKLLGSEDQSGVFDLLGKEKKSFVWKHPQASISKLRNLIITNLKINPPDPVEGWKIDISMIEFMAPADTSEIKPVKKSKTTKTGQKSAGDLLDSVPGGGQ